MYISVSEAADKFSLSKRRVQVLCEQGRIEGANMVSGVWLIPGNAQKPFDARVKQNIAVNQLSLFTADNAMDSAEISLHDVCDILSISSATARNWIRLGKLDVNPNGMFDKGYVQNLHNEIKSGNDSRLKSRRNKKSVSGNAIYKAYISDDNNLSVVADILKNYNNLAEEDLKVVLAYFAVQLFMQTQNVPNTLTSSIWGKIKSGNTVLDALISDMLDGVNISGNTFSRLQAISNYKVKYISTEDTLGFIYISLCDLSQRKQLGAYYTPERTVSLLLDSLMKYTNINVGDDVCDPCCGTGNFLIGLINRGVDPKNLFGQDIDQISVQIARINLFLRDNTLTYDQIVSHIVHGDTLKNTFDRRFNIVLGNPPWGYEFSKDDTDYLLNKYQTAKPKGMESYDLFVEKALSLLEPNGYMVYVLPEALLSVASHSQARKLIIQSASFQFVIYLGNAFSGVQCPAIILGIKAGENGCAQGCLVKLENSEYVINGNRKIDESCFSFNMTDDEYYCIEAIQSISNSKFLADHAKFGLGIVTGNNKEYVKSEPHEGYEIILKGSDILRYGRKYPETYIRFMPESFQQVAPTEVYRANEKLLYRFISEVPIFTYDNAKTLSLNSCNVLIPQIDGMNIKYVLAILNSSVASFFFSKKYNSLKLLKSHIESLPIPVIAEEIQDSIVNLVDDILNANGDAEQLYSILDEIIFSIYSLSAAQRSTIQMALRGKSLFLK